RRRWYFFDERHRRVPSRLRSLFSARYSAGKRQLTASARIRPSRCQALRDLAHCARATGAKSEGAVLTAERMDPVGGKSAVALRHVAFEDVGLLAPILQSAGWQISYRDAPVDDLSDFSIERSDLLIVLGGPIGVYDTDAYPFLSEELAVLE